MLTGKPAISMGISLNIEQHGHQPYGILTGPDQHHLKHATVYLRLKGVDAKWSFFGQDTMISMAFRSQLDDPRCILSFTGCLHVLRQYDVPHRCPAVGEVEGLV